MATLLGWMAAAVRRPRAVLAVLAAATVGMAGLASTLEVEVDLTQLGSEDSEAVRAMERVRDDFRDPAASVQVIVDAGAGANVLTAEGLDAVRAAQDVAVDALGPAVRTDADGRPQLVSLASATDALPAGAPDPGADAGGETPVGATIAQAVAANPQLAGLVSDDFDAEAARARATVVVALLDPALDDAERTDAGERVRAAFEDHDRPALTDTTVTVFSDGLFVAGMLDAIRAEVPLLFALALLVVVAILAATYRSVFDVAVGFVGLLVTVVWTLGFAALLGPAHLGWIGPLTQLVVVIPVLLVGLGIDYSVHLTARYREERAADRAPASAAGRTLHTVGAALVLATAATAVGFGSIAVAPLAMLADFGVVVAVGVVSAFVVMGLAVPAARVWRDRRRPRDDAGAVRELGLAGLMGGPTWLARRHPVVPLLVAAALIGASLLAAAELRVEFDRSDFVPDGSRVQTVLARQDALFGGGITESTFVVVDGDLTDPRVANTVWLAQRRAGQVEGVRTVAGTPQVWSVVTLAARAAGHEAWFTADADLAAIYERLRETVGRQRVDQLLADDAGAAVVEIRTTTGDAGAERVRDEIEAAFAPVERVGASVTVTSEPIVVAEMSDDLSAFQAQAIGLTLGVVLLLLTAYYGLVRGHGLLGLVAMIPAVVSAALLLGTMWALGISFNVLTATLTAIAVGIGVPYGVHVVNRFAEDLDDTVADDAVGRTLRATGAALAGSALTTLGAFVVLSFSGLPPMRSLGVLGAVGIAFALLAAVLVEPGALVLWARRGSRGTR